jgi:hypothetical protein
MLVRAKPIEACLCIVATIATVFAMRAIIDAGVSSVQRVHPPTVEHGHYGSVA